MATADQNGAHDGSGYHHHSHHPAHPLYHPYPPSAYVPPPPPPPGSAFHHQYHQSAHAPYGAGYNPYYGLYGQPPPTGIPPNPYLGPPPPTAAPQLPPPPGPSQPGPTGHYPAIPPAQTSNDLYHHSQSNLNLNHHSNDSKINAQKASSSQNPHKSSSNSMPQQSSSHAVPKVHSSNGNKPPTSSYPPHNNNNNNNSNNNNNQSSQQSSSNNSMNMSAASKAANDSSRRRRTRCKKCESCLRADCGDCHFCKDMKKFGGPGRMKQSCIARQCLAPVLPHTACCIICGRDGWEKLSIDPSLAMDETASSLMECSQCWEIVHPFCLSERNVDLFNHNKGYINKELPNSWECPKCVRSGNTSKQTGQPNGAGPSSQSLGSPPHSKQPPPPQQPSSQPQSHSSHSQPNAIPKPTTPKSINWTMMTEKTNKEHSNSKHPSLSVPSKRLRPDESPPPPDDEDKKRPKPNPRVPDVPAPGYFGANYNFPYNYSPYSQSHPYSYLPPPPPPANQHYPYHYPYPYPGQYPPYPMPTPEVVDHHSQPHSHPPPAPFVPQVPQPPPQTVPNQLQLPAPPPPVPHENIAPVQPIPQPAPEQLALPAPTPPQQSRHYSPEKQHFSPVIKSEPIETKKEPVDHSESVTEVLAKEEPQNTQIASSEDEIKVETTPTPESTTDSTIKTSDDMLQDDSTVDSSIVSNSISDQNVDSTAVSESENSAAEEPKKDFNLKKPMFVVRPAPLEVSSESEEESEEDTESEDDSATEEEGDAPPLSSEEKLRRKFRTKKIKKALKMFDREFPENLAYEKDVIIPVLKHLSRPDLLKCMTLCKQWNDWCHNPILWKNVSSKHKPVNSIMLIGIVRRQPKCLDLSFSRIYYEQLQWLLPRLPQMQSLKLVGTDESTIRALHSINCPLLSSLDLSYTSVGDDHLKLLLSRPEDKKPGLIELKTRLRFVSEMKLAGTNISDASIRLMMQTMPFLEKLDVSDCPLISDNAISTIVLSKGDRLIELYLSNCDQISDASLRLLRNCKSLEVLDLRKCSRISSDACEKFIKEDDSNSEQPGSSDINSPHVSPNGCKPVNIKKKCINNLRGKWQQKERKLFTKHRTTA